LPDSYLSQKKLNNKSTEPVYMKGPNPTEAEPLVVL